MQNLKLPKSWYAVFLSEKTKKRVEKTILFISIISFIVHLGLIYLLKFKVFDIGIESPLLDNPIAATYTPFTFILVYEVYLLVYYLPMSITAYVLTQYEIITLIIIRRLFKDLAALELTSDWFQVKNDLQFTYDLLASLILFFLLYLFWTKSKKQKAISDNNDLYSRFIEFKKIIAWVLVPILMALALNTFINWSIENFSGSGSGYSIKQINNIFFDEFFTLLIIVDVLLLLISFFYTDEFHKVIRNSGFIISTILIRLSFSVDGLINTLLIIVAVLFGLGILVIHNLYEEKGFGREGG